MILTTHLHSFAAALKPNEAHFISLMLSTCFDSKRGQYVDYTALHIFVKDEHLLQDVLRKTPR